MYQRVSVRVYVPKVRHNADFYSYYEEVLAKTTKHWYQYLCDERFKC